MGFFMIDKEFDCHFGSNEFPFKCSTIILERSHLFSGCPDRFLPKVNLARLERLEHLGL